MASQNVFESQLKRQGMEISQRKVILADSSKYLTGAFSVFARAEEIDLLITDAGLDGEADLSGLEIIRVWREDEE